MRTLVHRMLTAFLACNALAGMEVFVYSRTWLGIFAAVLFLGEIAVLLWLIHA